MSRWRPVCPECGYSLRRLESPRCPECGVDLPSANRSFRRWAVRRIPWDRIQRGSLFTAYLGTLLRILFVPCRTGRSLAVPDRWGRAIRLAFVHLLLCATGAALLSQEEYYAYWLIERFHPSPRHPAEFYLWPAPGHRVWVWAAQSLVAWMLVLLSFPLVGVLVNLGMPRRHRAAKLTGAKWSLYATPILPATLAGWYAYFLVYPQTGYYVPPHPPLPMALLAFTFGTWWVAGLTINQYDKPGRIPIVVFLAILYGALWWTMTALLFRGGPLEALL